MNRTLCSLAILKTIWLKGESDYIESFIPLIGNIIIKNQYSVITVEKLKNDFEKEYGLIIPRNPMLVILRRLGKRGFTKRVNGEFYPVEKKLSSLNISKISRETERKFEKVLKELKNFLDEQFPSYSSNFSESNLESGFLAFLKEHDLDILFASEDISLLPNVKVSNKIKYLISKFILENYRSEPEIYSFINDLSIGHALASMLLYKEFNSYSGKLKNVNIYLDSPLIFNLLGYNGKYKKDSTEELLKILNEEKVNLFILETNLDEVKTSLNDSYKRLRNGGNIDKDKASKILKYCYYNKKSYTDVQLSIVTLNEKLEEYNISLESVPGFLGLKDYIINEQGLTQTIETMYKNSDPDFDPNDYTQKERIGRDVKVLSGIYRFRRGYKPTTIKDSKAIFLTSNVALAKASRIFEVTEHNDDSVIPSCLTDVFLGTLIWLQSSQKTTSNLNFKKLIADCYSAVQPSDRLIDRFLEEVDKLKNLDVITSDQVYLLRTHKTAFDLLANQTMGDIDTIDEETPKEILEKIKAEIKGEETKKLKEEIEEHNKTKLKLKEKDNKIEKLECNIDEYINKKAKKRTGIVFVLMLFLLISGLIFGVINPINDRLLLIIIRIFTGTLTALNIAYGITFKKIEKKLANSIKNKMKRDIIGYEHKD